MDRLTATLDFIRYTLAKCKGRDHMAGPQSKKEQTTPPFNWRGRWKTRELSAS
ncbi:MAG TPA: hypothetical protein VLE70_21010 [Anaerolineae bacterium]|nr:hypothetical protein [Anaerolineae bacterium]